MKHSWLHGDQTLFGQKTQKVSYQVIKYRFAYWITVRATEKLGIHAIFLEGLQKWASGSERQLPYIDNEEITVNLLRAIQCYNIMKINIARRNKPQYNIYLKILWSQSNGKE